MSVQVASILEIHYPVTPQFESINEIFIYVLSLITLIMDFNYYDSLELLFKTQRNWQVWKKLLDLACFKETPRLSCI